MDYRIKKKGFGERTYNRRELRRLYLEDKLSPRDMIVSSGKDGASSEMTYLELYRSEQWEANSSRYPDTRRKHFGGLDFNLKIMLGVTLAVSGMMVFSTGPFSLVIALMGMMTAVSAIAFYRFFQQAIRVADRILERHEAEERSRNSIDIDV